MGSFPSDRMLGAFVVQKQNHMGENNHIDAPGHRVREFSCRIRIDMRESREERREEKRPTSGTDEGGD